MKGKKYDIRDVEKIIIDKLSQKQLCLLKDFLTYSKHSRETVNLVLARLLLEEKVETVPIRNARFWSLKSKNGTMRTNIRKGGRMT